MKSILPLLSLLIVFASCTTAYKTGQTPDDVYFSPARLQEEYVRVEKEDDRQYRREERQEDYYTYNDDRYLRIKVRNRNQWSYLDEYYRDPYAYNYNSNAYYYKYGYTNPRSYWNCNYNPYGNVVIINPRTPINNTPRKYNLHVFDNTNDDNNYNPKVPGKSRSYSTVSDRNDNPVRNTGNDLRNVFRTSESGNSGNSKPNSTQSSSSSNNSSSGSSNTNSGSNAPKRKF